MVRIDARGMRCPWPAVRLARVLRDGAGMVEILADDPQASTELAAAAEAADATIEIILDETYPTYVVTCR
jgi:tRNA 2-thiouridine synthesizing protein A